LIISHSHKFIFLKTHKTGGTSLQIALSRYCGKDDIISRLHKDDVPHLIRAGGLGEQNSEVPFSRYSRGDWFQYLGRGRKQYFSEHLEARNVKRWLGRDIWNSYYIFCFERNPFDKVLSYYYWRTRDKDITLDQFLEESLDELSDFDIYGIKNEIQADEVFLYENLQPSLEFLENKFGFTLDMSGIKAKSDHRPVRQAYETVLSERQKEKIAKVFEKELDLFYPDLTIK
jgi:hypothetical protein